jgi:hypothetical protein
LAERRQHHRVAGQPGVQVLAELAAIDHPGQVAVSGGDDADVDLDRAAGSDRHDLALLQDAEQRRLRAHRQVADLVEEERAAVCAADQPGPVLAGAGEGAALVTEELALDQRVRNRPAVDRDQLAGPLGQRVDGAGEELLAGPGLAQEDDRQERARDPLQLTQRARVDRREGDQTGRAGAQLVERDMTVQLVARPERDALAEPEQRVAELDQIAVAQDRAVDRAAVDHGAVLGAGVVQDPAPEAGLDARVLRRHPAIRHAHVQLVAGGAGVALHLPVAAAAEQDLGDAAQGVARRAGGEPVAFERHDQDRLGRGRQATRALLPVHAEREISRSRHHRAIYFHSPCTTSTRTRPGAGTPSRSS